MMQNVNATFNTTGDGYWSGKRKSVRIVGMSLPYVNDDATFGELCVYFNEQDWDTAKDGLIYTDKGFVRELREYLQQQGIKGKIEYSEQGMQGDNYVSFDVGENFITEWNMKVAGVV
jgi:hypothetical protein